MYELLVSLIKPLPFFFAMGTIGLVWTWRGRGGGSRRPLAMVTASFACLAISCTPAFAFFACGTLEWMYPWVVGRPEEPIDAIVVFSCEFSHSHPLRPEPEMGRDTLLRCQRALRMYRQDSPLPVLVSGGEIKFDSRGATSAGEMAKFLALQGVAKSDLLIEDRSATTYENAVESAKLLRKHGLNKVALVVDHVDLFRAVRCCEKQGIQVVPCGTNRRAARFEWTAANFVPSPRGAAATHRAAHEWLGVAWYLLKGRM